jgi:hypothetical protein
MPRHASAPDWDPEETTGNDAGSRAVRELQDPDALVMLGKLGYHVTINPYTNNGYWTSLVSQINGQMPRRSGYPSPATIQGLNMPNRIVLGTSVKAGDKFQIAIFGVNGPISFAPMNFVWFREAKIEFFR